MAPDELYTLMCSDEGLALKFDLEDVGVDKMMLKVSGKTGFPYKDVVLQWSLRKKAQKKFSKLLEQHPHWLFSDATIIEQATPELIANERFIQHNFTNAADLTAGLGIDFYGMLLRSKRARYVDSDERRAQFAQWNFQNINHAEITLGSAEDAWQGERFDMVFIDPDRRSSGKRTFLPEDSSPNLNKLLPNLSPFANQIWIKLSPMVDITELRRHYPDAHIRVWSLADEVKEITLCIGENDSDYSASILSNSGKRQDWYPSDNGQIVTASQVGGYIYYPDAAIRKLQFWGELCAEYNLQMLDVNTHVFTSNILVEGFPGRVWKTTNVSKPGDMSLINKDGMHVLRKNYPQTVAQLRKRYRINEGNTLLLACKVAGKNRWITADRI